MVGGITAATVAATSGLFTMSWLTPTYYQIVLTPDQVSRFLSEADQRLAHAVSREHLKSRAWNSHIHLVSQRWTLWPLTIQSWNSEHGLTVGVWSLSSHTKRVVNDTLGALGAEHKRRV